MHVMSRAEGTYPNLSDHPGHSLYLSFDTVTSAIILTLA